MSDPDLVRFGASGSVSLAPTGTTLPTDATAALDAAFADLGLISEDGATISKALTTSELKAWGNGVVRKSVTDAPFSVSFVALETSDEVLSLYFGADNTGSYPVAKYVVKGQPDIIEKALVLEWEETVGAETYNYRLVLPRAAVESVEDLTINSNDAVMYGFTFAAQADADGNVAYLYTTDGDIGGS